MLKLSDPQSWLQELVQEKDCGLGECWWEPDFYLKNALEQVTTSHWANWEKSWPHAITLGPTHPHTMRQVAKENESQTSGLHLRQLL